jgi:hypothetical protein
MKFHGLSCLVPAIALIPMLLAGAGVSAADYTILDRIKVGDGGGYDYATFDSITRRVYMARDEFTTVIDVDTGAASRLSSAVKGHIAIPIPGTTLIALTRGQDAEISVVDVTADRVVGDIPAGMAGPDGGVYDPFSKNVFITSRRGFVFAADPRALKLIATIPIGGTVEFPATNGVGKIFANVASVPEIAVIDATKDVVTTRYKLPGCMDATGLAYAPQTNLLISSCHNHVAKFIDADTGADVATIPIGDGPDAVIYDPVRKIAFIPCLDGILEIVSMPDRAHIALIQQMPTQVGTRTGAVDPKTGRLYMMASKHDPAAPPGGAHGGPQLAGSYEVLVAGTDGK